jgi:RNA recognition motif-containing protein
MIICRKSAVIASVNNFSRGFAYVEMENCDVAKKAIDTLDSCLLHGRRIRVSLFIEKGLCCVCWKYFFLW